MNIFRPKFIKTSCVALALCASIHTSASAQTRVKVATDLGDVYIKLYDTLAPITVANFLSYVNSGAYDGTIFHRSIPGFVLQSGGFEETTSGSPLLSSVVKGSPIQNEFGVSNTRGTIAMAKLGGDPDSATSEWFVNLADNSSNLDNQNGGFTVFGEVEIMPVIDKIAATRTVNIGGAFTNLPLKDLTHPDSSGATDVASIERRDFVTIQSMTVEPATVPEPSSSALVLLGAGSCLLLRRR